MLPGIARVLRHTVPLASKCASIEIRQLSPVFVRFYRSRKSLHTPSAINNIPGVDNLGIPIIEKDNTDVVDPEDTDIKESGARIDVDAEDAVSIPIDTAVINELDAETDGLFGESEPGARITDGETITIDHIDKMDFEDVYFKLSDKAKKHIYDDVNDTLRSDINTEKNEETTFVNMNDAKSLFDSIMSMSDNEVAKEEDLNATSILMEDEKEPEKDVKRSTWFDFMPAKEKPSGMFESYDHDQIFSSLEFDLLSRNAAEVYKFEKDDLFLNEEILRHTKMPEPIQAPKIPLYPKFEEYAKWVTFALNRNADYSIAEKKHMIDILAKLGSLDSDIDESPKSEFKQKKYL